MIGRPSGQDNLSVAFKSVTNYSCKNNSDTALVRLWLLSQSLMNPIALLVLVCIAWLLISHCISSF